MGPQAGPERRGAGAAGVAGFPQVRRGRQARPAQGATGPQGPQGPAGVASTPSGWPPGLVRGGPGGDVLRRHGPLVLPSTGRTSGWQTAATTPSASCAPRRRPAGHLPRWRVPAGHRLRWANIWVTTDDGVTKRRAPTVAWSAPTLLARHRGASPSMGQTFGRRTRTATPSASCAPPTAPRWHLQRRLGPNRRCLRRGEHLGNEQEQQHRQQAARRRRRLAGHLQRWHAPVRHRL